MHPILKLLDGTDRRSTGRSDEAVEMVLEQPDLFPILFDGILSDSPVLRMRSADAAEKISSLHPEYLLGLEEKLLYQAAVIPQQEVRWHAAQMMARVPWKEPQLRQVYAVLESYFLDKSNIVKVFAMQAMFDLFSTDDQLRPGLIVQFESLMINGSAGVKSRGNKLLGKLEKMEYGNK